MAITAFRSVHFSDFGRTDDGTLVMGMTGARSVHGDTEGVTAEGYHVNVGSYVHADDVADYLLERARAQILAETGGRMSDMLESLAMMIRTAGV